MRIFLSWSGERSRKVAEALREWLPYVFPTVEPWMSAADIDRGSRWSLEISDQLNKANVGIICLTPENLEAPWVLFEAGALSKAISKSLVCTYLFQLKALDIKGPLSQFQATLSERDDTRRLILSLNRAHGPGALSEERLGKTFEVWWPDLGEKLGLIENTEESPVSVRRSDRDLLEEILSLQRRNDLRPLLPEIAKYITYSLKLAKAPVGSELEQERPKESIQANLVVDLRPLMGAEGREISLEYPVFGTVSDLLNNLYIQHLREVVKPYTYGRVWALKNIQSGHVLADMGGAWARTNLGYNFDSRLLSDVGIEPGMRFEAIPILN